MVKHSPYDEQELLSRIANRDEKAMRQIFDSFYPRLHFFALRFLKEDTDAEDIVQETFVNFWLAITEKGLSPGNIQAYLYGIIRNKCVSFLRHKQLQDQKNNELLAQSNPVLEQQMDEILLREEFYHRVYQQFSQLTPIQAQVMRFLYVDELSVADVAAQLNTTPNNVRNHKARALEKLRTILDGEILPCFIFFLIFS